MFYLRHFSSPLPGILEDDSLSKQDSGNYTCTVNNSVGTARRSMYITVLGIYNYVADILM